MFEEAQLMKPKEAYDTSLRLEPRGKELSRAGLPPSRDLFITTILYEFQQAERRKMVLGFLMGVSVSVCALSLFCVFVAVCVRTHARPFLLVLLSCANFACPVSRPCRSTP